jgi:hypothetical protein
MTNHSGGYMLNEVLKLLEKESVFEFLGKVKTQNLAREIVKISDDYDCSSGEVLEDINERIGICYCCRASTEAFLDGLCESCYGVGFSET